jgi:hypothetical protein
MFGFTTFVFIQLHKINLLEGFNQLLRSTRHLLVESKNKEYQIFPYFNLNII